MDKILYTSYGALKIKEACYLLKNNTLAEK